MHTIDEKENQIYLRERLKESRLFLQNNLLFICVAIVLCSFFCIHALKLDASEQTTKTVEGNVFVVPASGELLEQVIVDYEPRELVSVNVLFGTFGKTNHGTLSVALCENGEQIEVWLVELANLSDNTYYAFPMNERVSLKKDSEYTLQIEETYSGENQVAVWMNKEKDPKSTTGDGLFQDGMICYTLTYKGYSETQLRNAFIIIGITAFVLAAVAIVCRIKESILVTAMLALLMLAYSYVLPAGEAPDESAHFWRAYEIANVGPVSMHLGGKGVGGNILPKAIESFTDKDAILDYNDVGEIYFGNTALYSPISYLPQAVGIRITQLLSNRVNAIFYGGRIASAITVYFLCLLAFCRVPFGKRVLFLLMTFPMSVQEMVSMAPDGFTIAISLFFFAEIMRLSYTDDRLSNINLLVLTITAIILSQLKIVYVTLLLLLFMLPADKFKSRKSKWLYCFGVIITAGGLNLLWLSISMDYLVEFKPGVDSQAQVKFILSNLPGYYIICVRTLLLKAQTWVGWMIGSSMGMLNVETTASAWLLAEILFICEVCLCRGPHCERDKYNPVILIVTFLLASALIFTSLYVQWTPLKDTVIDGIQGRYFTPIMPELAFFAILMREKKWIIQAKSSEGAFLFLFVLFYNGIVLVDMANYYFFRI